MGLCTFLWKHWHAALDDMDAGTLFQLHVAVHRAYIYAVPIHAVLYKMVMLPEEAASGRNVELAEHHSPTNPSNKTRSSMKIQSITFSLSCEFLKCELYPWQGSFLSLCETWVIFSLLHSYHILLQPVSDVGEISVTSSGKARWSLILKSSVQARNQISIFCF